MNAFSMPRGLAIRIALVVALLIAGILPGFLKILSLAGLYSFYLFYLGAPKLLKTPQDKTVIFTAVVTVITMIAMSLCAALMY